MQTTSGAENSLGSVQAGFGCRQAPFGDAVFGLATIQGAYFGGANDFTSGGNNRLRRHESHGLLVPVLMLFECGNM